MTAFGLFALASGEALAQDAVGAPGDSPSIEKQGGGQAQNKEAGTGQFSLPVRIIEDPDKAQASQRASEDAAQRARDDLAAQQSMAESNKQVIVISWWQLGLAGVGTILVFGSLGLALWSNWLTRRAVEITEETAKRQLRAYVNVESAKAEFFADRNEIRFMIIIRNRGQTPARGVSEWATCHVAQNFDHSVPVKDRSGGSVNPMGPGGKLKIEYGTLSRRITFEAVQAARAGRTNLWAHGLVEYIDIYDTPQHVDFRFRVEPGEIQKPDLEICPEGNDAT